MALYIPRILIRPPTPLLLICFVLQVVAAVLAAIGLWQGHGWAAAAVLVLAAAITATQLVEILLGIVPYLRAVLLSVLAIVAALLLARSIRTGRPVT